MTLKDNNYRIQPCCLTCERSCRVPDDSDPEPPMRQCLATDDYNVVDDFGICDEYISDES